MIGPASTSSPSQPLEEKRAQFRSAFFHVAPSMFLGALDQTIIATALPAIAGSLGGLSYLALVVTGYLLAAAVAAPLYGRMGDAFGRKTMLLWALSLFVAGSAACAIAPTLPILICARAAGFWRWRPHDPGASSHRRSGFSKRERERSEPIFALASKVADSRYRVRGRSSDRTQR
jgi:MFS family permease